MVSVVMIGATGAVGGAALAELMAAPEVSRITVLGRRAVAVTHPKLRQAVVDLAVPDSYAAHLAGHDVAICTLGVGQPTKTDRTTFLAVDQAMPRAFATACRAGGLAVDANNVVPGGKCVEDGDREIGGSHENDFEPLGA